MPSNKTVEWMLAQRKSWPDKSLRTRKGLCEELSISTTQLAKIEKGEVRFTPELLNEVLDTYEVDGDERAEILSMYLKETYPDIHAAVASSGSNGSSGAVMTRKAVMKLTCILLEGFGVPEDDWEETYGEAMALM